ncbi:MAG: exo-alpha-sialidase [Promethearchaeota archaeon]
MHRKDLPKFSAFAWAFLSLIVLILGIFSLIIWKFILDKFAILNIYIGIPLEIIASIILFFLFYNLFKTLKQKKTKLYLHSRLFAKSLIIFGFIIFSIQLPLGYKAFERFDNFEKPLSPYDSFIGIPFQTNASGLVYTTIPGVPSAHCSSLIYLQNGDLLCAWYAGSYEKATDVAIWMSRCHPNMNWEGSLDLNWSSPQIVADTINHSEGQPVWYQTPNGRLFLFYQTLKPTSPLFGTWGPVIETGWDVAKIKYIYSDDNGYTWSEPVYLWNFYFWTLRNPPLLTSKGDVILPIDYLGSSLFLINKNPNLEGKWLPHARLYAPRSIIQPSLVELDSGRIMAVFRTGNGRIYKSYSPDGGYSWFKPKPMRFPNPDSCVALLHLQDGRNLILCNPKTNSRDTLSFILGDPSGHYWSEPSPVKNHTGHEYSYPSMIQLPDNSVVFSYTNLRQNIGWGRFTIEALNHMQINFNIFEE